MPGGLDGSKNVVADGTRVDSTRYPTLVNVDVRLAKNMKFGDKVTATLIADLFNALNQDTELNRFRRANSAAFNRLDEVLSPRILRVGLRVGF